MPEEEKNNKIWILFTNDKKISSKKAVLAYKDRWQIEIFFKQCKNELGLKILPGRDFRIASMHVSSVLLAYIGLISLFLEEQQKNEVIPIAIKNWKNKFIKVILSIVLERYRINFEFEEVWIHSWSIMEKNLNGGILM
jgi:IS4 transposase